MSTFTKVGQKLTKGGPASWFLFLFFSLLLLVNAAYTTAFGADFCGDVLNSPILGGGMTLLFLDAAALAWFVARRYDAGNDNQLQVAQTMSIATLAGSCILTLAQLGMTSGTKVSDGVEWWVGFVGLIIVALFAIANFVAAYAYQHFDPAELDKEKDRAQLLVEQNRAELTAQRARDQKNQLIDDANESAFQMAAEQIHQAKPIIAARLATDALHEHFRAVGMDDLISYEAKSEPATPPSRALSAEELAALVADTVATQLQKERKAERRAKRKIKKRKQGAAAGAEKESSKSKVPPSPALCDCGQPVGTADGECSGGDGCMILEKAAEQKALREVEERADEDRLKMHEYYKRSRDLYGEVASFEDDYGTEDVATPSQAKAYESFFGHPHPINFPRVEPKALPDASTAATTSPEVMPDSGTA